jgi:hypothetical protein
MTELRTHRSDSGQNWRVLGVLFNRARITGRLQSLLPRVLCRSRNSPICSDMFVNLISLTL